MASGKSTARATANTGGTDQSSGLPPRDEIAAYHLIDEDRLVGGLLERAIFTADERRKIATLAHRLVVAVRDGRQQHSGIDAFMLEYGLTSEEGVILMCEVAPLVRTDFPLR